MRPLCQPVAFCRRRSAGRPGQLRPPSPYGRGTPSKWCSAVLPFEGSPSCTASSEEFQPVGAEFSAWGNVPVQGLAGDAEFGAEIADLGVGLAHRGGGQTEFGRGHLEGRPPLRPRARAEARPAMVRSEMSSRSNSARAGEDAEDQFPGGGGRLCAGNSRLPPTLSLSSRQGHGATVVSGPATGCWPLAANRAPRPPAPASSPAC